MTPNRFKFRSGKVIALWGTIFAFGIAGCQYLELRAESGGGREFFTGLLIYDQFTVFFRPATTLTRTKPLRALGGCGTPRRDGSDR